MRKRICVPMIMLCLLLSGCGSGRESKTVQATRQPYQAMKSCTMEATVTCGVGSEEEIQYQLNCQYIPDGKCTVKILAPESVKGIEATIDGKSMSLTYGGVCLNAGTMSTEKISPAGCLPQMVDALRSGWLLEENEEKWKGVSCLRLSLDRSGKHGKKIVSTVWLRKKDGTPAYGEISVDGKIILKAEFTKFAFGAILSK